MKQYKSLFEKIIRYKVTYFYIEGETSIQIFKTESGAKSYK